MLKLPPAVTLLRQVLALSERRTATGDRSAGTRTDDTDLDRLRAMCAAASDLADGDFEGADPGPVDSVFIEHAARERRQSLRDRSRVDAMLGPLLRGEGIAPFSPSDPGGAHFCYRYGRGVLEIRSHDAFRRAEDSGFELHLHGSGVLARRDGSAVESPDSAFFSALDMAWRSGGHAFVV